MTIMRFASPQGSTHPNLTHLGGLTDGFGFLGGSYAKRSFEEWERDGYLMKLVPRCITRDTDLSNFK